MTNNPTIDGVSADPRQWSDRQILDFIGVALRNVDPLGSVVLSEIRQGFEYMLSQQPAVERQECITFPRDLTDEMAEAIALRANCCGGIADDVWEALVQCVEKPKFPDIEVCGSWPVQSEPRPRLSALQSTIAQLQARIVELESEEPEWSAMQQRLGDENARLRDRIAELESWRGEPTGYVSSIGNGFVRVRTLECLAIEQPLYAAPPAPVAQKLGEPTAYLRNEGTPNNLVVCPFDHPDAFKVFRVPPAPVAVVLPERMRADPYDESLSTEEYYGEVGWNACLDATAALNEVRK